MGRLFIHQHYLTLNLSFSLGNYLQSSERELCELLFICFSVELEFICLFILLLDLFVLFFFILSPNYIIYYNMFFIPGICFSIDTIISSIITTRIISINVAPSLLNSINSFINEVLSKYSITNTCSKYIP